MAHSTAAQKTSRKTAQNPPETPPVGWMLRRSMWILPTLLGLGYLSFVSYFWLAKKWNSVGLRGMALVLLGLTLLYLPLTFFDYEAAETPAMHLLLWIGPTLLGLYLNPAYLRSTWRQEVLGQDVATAAAPLWLRLRNISDNDLSGADVDSGSIPQRGRKGPRPTQQRAAQNGDVRNQGYTFPPLPADETWQQPESWRRTAPRPEPRYRSWDEIDTQRTFGTVGLVNLATATVDELEVLPFISRSRAEQLVALRDRGRLRDITDVIAALQLQPHEAAQIRARLAFGQPTGANSHTGAAASGVTQGGAQSGTARAAGKTSRRGRKQTSARTPAGQQPKPAASEPPRQGRILDV